MYSMGLTKFQEIAKDAKVRYKIGQLVLVNTEILDEYLETFWIKSNEGESANILLYIIYMLTIQYRLLSRYIIEALEVKGVIYHVNQSRIR